MNSATDSPHRYAYMGPAAVVGNKNKYLTAGVFPNYFWKIGSSSQGDRTPDINQGSRLYFLIFNLPDAWQLGMNPTISYNHQASEGNRWNVPVGLFVGRTVKIGSSPMRTLGSAFNGKTEA